MSEELWHDSFTQFLATSATAPAEAESSAVSNIEPVHFEFLVISDACRDLATDLLFQPREALPKCHQILTSHMRSLLAAKNPDSSHDLLSRQFRFRLNGLSMYHSRTTTVPGNDLLNQLVEFSGTVVKTCEPKMLEKMKNFQCSKCRGVFSVDADPEVFNKCPAPLRCPDSQCAGTAIKEVVSSCGPQHTVDYQEIKLQEKVGNAGVGTVPKSVWVVLEEDLVDVCKPGDDVSVVGIVIRRWGPLGRGLNGRTDIQISLLANNVVVKNHSRPLQQMHDEYVEFERFWRHHRSSELEARNRIVASFCPQVYGLFAVKLALCVILSGGVERLDEEGTKLLVGDPGTGKSQLLKYASKLITRSVLTTGIGSTNAGLTVSAVRDGGRWHLEAGALVLADGGICCIDEFNAIKDADRVALHEAMEQQSISVAKAGMVCKLQTRCSIIACCNPSGKYDSDQPLTVNLGIASPLLSRFDLVFLLLDSANPTWDKMVSSYILKGVDPASALSKDDCDDFWTFEKLRSYFLYCKSFNPEMSDEASEIIRKYFQKQRSRHSSSMARVTTRLLQSAVRLAQGHAKLMCHDKVTVVDSITAILLLETSMDGGWLSSTNTLHTTFPSDSQRQFDEQAEKVLYELDLHHIWRAELQQRLHTSTTPVFTPPEERQPVAKKAEEDSHSIGGGKRKASPSSIWTPHGSQSVCKKVRSHEASILFDVKADEAVTSTQTEPDTLPLPRTRVSSGCISKSTMSKLQHFAASDADSDESLDDVMLSQMIDQAISEQTPLPSSSVKVANADVLAKVFSQLGDEDNIDDLDY